MQKLFIYLFFFISANCFGQNKLGAVGQWREHYSNYSAKQLVIGDQLYGATTNQLFSIDTNNNVIELIGKSNGLHQAGISSIAWDNQQNQLVIAYNNSAIDIKKGDQVFYINDLSLSNLYNNKNINHISLLGNWALLACNFGIVVIDLIKHEIKDTWFPNNNRQSTITYQTVIINDSLFAITENGLWTCPIKNNWSISNQWTHSIAYDNLQVNKMVVADGKLFLYNTKQVFQYPNTQNFYTNNAFSIQNINANQNKLYLSLKTNLKGSVLQLNADGSTNSIVDNNNLGIPMDIKMTGNTIWIADSLEGLLKHGTNDEWITLGGPRHTIQGKASIHPSYFVTPFGNSEKGFSSYNTDGWVNYSFISNTPLPIMNASAIHPIDNSFWFTSNNSIFHFDPITQNSALISTSSNKGALKDIYFTKKGVGWIQQDNIGLLKQENDNWNTILAPNNFAYQGMQQFVVNDQGQAWMIAPNNQGLYIYQSNEYYPTSQWIQKTTSTGLGNLPSNKVLSILLDNTGAIWVGTDNGIGIFQCGDISKEACDAFIPIVSNNNFNAYLFQKENVLSMAVDGANRKWIGTNNGVWLLSSDGYKVVEHFTSFNSPLPNDTVLQIKVAPNSGEIFFITKNEMVSYRGTATTGTMQQEAAIDIFPNPVAPDYNGLISFKGLVENAFVKITDLNGRLVYQTRALGGQAVWNGKTYEGNKVATGIYLVLVRDELGNEKGVGKLVMTNGLMRN